MGEILATDDLTKNFNSVTAVDGLDMAVGEGELVGLIGPNGAGKTTTLNLITGFLEPTSGSVRFAGRDVTGAGPHVVSKLGMGRTFQISRPFGRLSVHENLLVPNVPYGPQERERRIEEVLDTLDLDGVVDERADALSGGQKKLLELARVLMLDPDLILLDEPAAGVNPALMDDILANVTRINERGTAILVIEHDMSVIKELCERVIVLSAGRQIMTGSFEDVQSDERVREAYLGGE